MQVEFFGWKIERMLKWLTALTNERPVHSPMTHNRLIWHVGNTTVEKDYATIRVYFNQNDHQTKAVLLAWKRSHG